MAATLDNGDQATTTFQTAWAVVCAVVWQQLWMARNNAVFRQEECVYPVTEQRTWTTIEGQLRSVADWLQRNDKPDIHPPRISQDSRPPNPNSHNQHTTTHGSTTLLRRRSTRQPGRERSRKHHHRTHRRRRMETSLVGSHLLRAHPHQQLRRAPSCSSRHRGDRAKIWAAAAECVHHRRQSTRDRPTTRAHTRDSTTPTTSSTPISHKSTQSVQL